MDMNEVYEYRRVCLERLLVSKYNNVKENLARSLGISSSYVQRMLYPPGKKHKKNIGDEYVQRINEKHPDWLEQDNVEKAPDVMLSMPLNISGEIQGGDNGYLKYQQFPEGFTDGCVMHPVKNPRCYALRVRGDSMYPRIKHREVIVVDPDHPIEIGDEVVVSLKDERQMVKVLANRREGEVTLKSINDSHNDINIKIEDISEMHFVAAIIPIGSVCKKIS